MLRYAYQLGVKLAFTESGYPPREDVLTQVLQTLPDVPPEETQETKKRHPGEPDNKNEEWSSGTANFAFDTLSNLGLVSQGPDTTGV